MSIELKIKAKHLALEPQVIRHEEAKLKKQIKYHRSSDETSAFTLARKLDELINHRRWNVRNESRATNLARAFLAGDMYSKHEKRSKANDMMFFMYILPRIHVMVTKYGKGDQRKMTRDDIWQWSKK
jgi:hypothetical protein